MVDLERHARHVMLPQVGAEGVKRLNQSSVACIGAGGLGCPVMQYLAAAGIGKITIIDDDLVDITNLQRQILHRSQDIGIPKVDSAKRFINELDPSVEVITHQVRLSSQNASQLLKGHDVVVDGTDNIPSRYLINDTCRDLGIPWVYASIYRFEGQVSVFNFNNGPDYRDLFSEAPPDELVPSCSEAGVLGVLPGMVGSIQASEAIKVILGIGETLSGRLLIIDALSTTIRTLNFEADQTRGRQVQESETSEEESMFQSINPVQTIEKMNNGWKPFILDVRSEMEYNQAHLNIVNHQVAHEEVLSAVDSIPKDQDILVHCRSGQRSQVAILFLLQAGYDGSLLYNLDEGISGWAAVDPDGIIYG
jgi:molybdopterin/thiamine biosynthesis adenylyltransferase/rhodanese-related sulfurtransferase|tara:strand:- start:9878 stop:10969 length:1092 start_codon:yes stop_codon:yes gene_type:complete